MDRFSWSDDYQTGITSVDEEHRFLVDLINQFGISLASPNAPTASDIDAAIKQLFEYTQYHFSNEENLMVEKGLLQNYQDHHREMHQHFISQVSAISTTLGIEPRQELQLYDFLCNWVTVHILGEDHVMGQQIALITAGYGAEEAHRLALLSHDSCEKILSAACKTLHTVVNEQNISLAIVNNQLRDRIKEMSFRKTFALILASGHKSLGKLLADTIKVIPTGWSYADITCVRIQFGDMERTTPNFEETQWKMSADILVNKNPLGTIDVCYLSEKPTRDQGPFLREECALLQDIASMLGTQVEIIESDQKLSRSEELYRVVNENAHSAIILTDGLGTIQSWNHAAERIFEYKESEMIGQSITLLAPEGARTKHNQAIERTLKEGFSAPAINKTANLTGLKQSGQEFPLELNYLRCLIGQEVVCSYIIHDISEQMQAEDANNTYVLQLKEALMNTVEVATMMGEMRDPYTAGHSRRVAEIAVAIARELGFDQHRLDGLRIAGLLHDVGKIQIPAEILAKPRRLSPVEYLLVQEHVQAGYSVLKDVAFPWPVAEVARQHHERIDGTGYPRGLKGDDIIIEARIMAVADVVEAMSSHRPYRAGLGLDAALAEIEDNRGTLFDVAVVDAAMIVFREQGFVIPE